MPETRGHGTQADQGMEVEETEMSAPMDAGDSPAAIASDATGDVAESPVSETSSELTMADAVFNPRHLDVFEDCDFPGCTVKEDRLVYVGDRRLRLCDEHRNDDGLREALGA